MTSHLQTIAVGDQMNFGMQDLDFAQIYQICPNPNLIKYAQIKFIK